MFEGLSDYNSDLLTAVPEDDVSRDRLVEAIKDRAKSLVKSRNYPEAIRLYSKGIEVAPGNAVLFANRSMCQLGMGQAKEALQDAETALSLDRSYVKGYYRKAMALLSLKENAAARESLEQGLKLAPDDKELQQQLSKIQTEAPKPAKDSTSPSRAQSTAPKKASPSTREPSTDMEVVDEEDEKGIIRGYKKTSDGRTTSYFTNELDEHAKALIGNIAPKKIEGAEVVEPAVSNGASAWNAAGTVETITHTGWAVRRLEELLEMVEEELPGGGSVAVSKVKSVGGDAQVLFVRGKRKNVYDMYAELEWVLRDSSGSEMGTGSLKLSDISADLDLEVSVSVKDATAAGNELVRSHVKSNKVGLQPALVKAVDRFVADFMAK